MHIDRFPSILSISECHSVFHNRQQNYITPSSAKHFSIPLSFRPTGYTGSGQCERYHTVQKKALIKTYPQPSLQALTLFSPYILSSSLQQLPHLHFTLCQHHWGCNSIWFPRMYNPLLPRWHSGTASQECQKEKEAVIQHSLMKTSDLTLHNHKGLLLSL